MRKTILTMFVLAVALSSCKVAEKMGSKKDAAAPAQTENTAPPKVFTAEPVQQGGRENPTSDQMYAKPEATADAKPISMRKENFTFSQQGDQAAYGNKNFFVIVGSFGSYENANKLKADLSTKGFSPVILKSESGFFRVCSNSYTEEADARAKVSEIRKKYTNFSDCWLLIKN